MSVYSEYILCREYNYTQRCNHCKTLYGQDIPFIETDNFICDDCFEELCTTKLMIVLSDGNAEFITVNPNDVTLDKVEQYATDYIETIRDYLDNPNVSIVEYTVIN